VEEIQLLELASLAPHRGLKNAPRIPTEKPSVNETLLFMGNGAFFMTISEPPSKR